MAHVVACASSTEGKPVRLINPMFVTEEQASRKWISRAMHRLVYGKYKIGSNDGNVTVVDRRTGTPFEEDIATHDHLRLRLLYESPLVRTMEWTNVRRYFRSKTLGYGMTYNDPKSAAHIPAFIRVYGVNVNEAERLPKEYSTMNEFFGRKLKPGVRPIEKPNDPTVAVSATDSRTMVFESIDQVTRLWIKGKKFSIGRLLDDETESARYVDGSLIIWRLAPHDYHRFHLPVDGVLSQPKNVPGEYYAVSPIGSRSPLDVLGENKRTVSYIESPHFGRVAYVCIGATEVASIVLTSQPGVSLHKGTEHGYFQYGGSTVVAVFEKGKIKFDADLITNSKEPVETYIQMGTSIGTSISTTIGTSFGIPVSSIIS
ncbi:hypothetical protein GQ42DRAFT_167738 [Ramicandelaber brevisporus]|nr:hypothetical protein GQ42DRAFT_167738 [Ramicandelaber brevisporus]